MTLNPFVSFMIKRGAMALLTFTVALILIFLLPRIIPGNPLAITVYRIVSTAGTNPEQVKAVERMLMEYFQLNKPLHEQFFLFIRNLFRGYLGKSIMYFPLDVNDVIAMYLPWTLALVVPAVVLAWIVGNTIGVIAAMSRGKLVDKVLLPLLAVLQGTPPYVWAMYLILIFAIWLKIFPASGGWDPTLAPSPTTTFMVSFLHHYVLPFLSIFMVSLGGWGLSMRNIALQELTSDYMDYVRVLGLSQRKTFRYLFKSSALPQIVGLAIVLGWSFSGSLITEIVFNYPGIGRMLWGAIQSQDYPLIQGGFIIVIAAIILANYISELIFAVIDPRTRYAYGM
ncbi:binding-protein-dependent transport systems inner membrane component [Ignisphaera aggregans DSM 17230]|uniref:Binding-protein-dependent transport systems inner membrane component n=1 Tax=Ignisphaera aggregans (strain DSM 17230 / JCM 13409 / AQ1.S1) TaxID=583356 RepID=E0SS38_IGNAA|nr:binding-protein-dependent transport systems inner membrane component [Ignisphaera aggregans DSM 17230]